LDLRVFLDFLLEDLRVFFDFLSEDLRVFLDFLLEDLRVFFEFLLTDPGHNHSYDTFRRNTGNNADTGSGISAKDNTAQYTENSGSTKTGITINSSGSSTPFDNRPKYYALCYIMKQ
jgi:hypothetical protein